MSCHCSTEQVLYELLFGIRSRLDLREKYATKSHLPRLICRAGRSDISGPERVSAPSNAEIKLHGVSSTGRVLKFAYVFVHAVGGAAPLHSPRKPLRQRQPKTGSDGWVLCKPPNNFQRFHDNLYQIQFSGCSALPESGRQSLPHPYSPLRAPAFFRISRNRVQAHLNKEFWMDIFLSL